MRVLGCRGSRDAVRGREDLSMSGDLVLTYGMGGGNPGTPHSPGTPPAPPTPALRPRPWRSIGCTRSPSDEPPGGPAPSPELRLLALGPPPRSHSAQLPALDRAVRSPPAHYRRGASQRGLRADHAPAEPAAGPPALPAGRRPCLRPPPRGKCPPGHPESRRLGVEWGRREFSLLRARLCKGNKSSEHPVLPPRSASGRI